MKCTNPELKKQLACYQFGLLSNDEKVRLEAHLFDCPDCLEDLYQFTPIINLLEAMPDQFLPALQPRPSAIERLRHAGAKVLATIKRCWLATPTAAPKTIWERIPFRLLVPVMAAILIITLIWLLPERSVVDLAIIEKAPYRPLQLRGLGQDVKRRQLFDEGMAFYQADNYAAAIEKLSAYTIQAPDDPWGFYYLGISVLLTGSASQAVSYLVMATTIAQQQGERSLHEQCLWYLANAYLKLDQKEAALITFQQIIASKGKLAAAAEAQIVKIQTRLSKKNVN